MNTFQWILLMALAVVVAVKGESQCTYGDKTYREGEAVYKDLCSYCICNEAGTLSDCATEEGNCVESCFEGYKLKQFEGKCCPTCVPDDSK